MLSSIQPIRDRLHSLSDTVSVQAEAIKVTVQAKVVTIAQIIGVTDLANKEYREVAKKLGKTTLILGSLAGLAYFNSDAYRNYAKSLPQPKDPSSLFPPLQFEGTNNTFGGYYPSALFVGVLFELPQVYLCLFRNTINNDEPGISMDPAAAPMGPPVIQEIPPAAPGGPPVLMSTSVSGNLQLRLA